MCHIVDKLSFYFFTLGYHGAVGGGPHMPDMLLSL